jgi:Dolichyl-phosphate-mannose-protein mannosyltransferase
MRRPSTLLAGLLIVLGVALRVGGFAANRALWGDEVAVALNLRFRDFQGLLRPLDYDQTMPLPLLMGIKSIASVLGFSECVLRLLPFLAGCLLLVALWITFDRFFGRSVALIGLGLAALWQPLIYYSSELKQYGCDACVTVVTLWFALSTLDRKDDASRWPGLIAWGAAAILLSQPAVFVLAAVGVAALLDPRIVSSKKWRVDCFIAAACWLTEFVALFWFSYRYTSGNAFMRSFWASSFLDPGPGFRHKLVVALWTMLGTGSFTYVRSFVLVVVAAAGLYGIWRSRRAQGIALALGPYGFLLAAAVLKQYPIYTRLILFAVPLLFWIYASGLTAIAALVPVKLRTAALAALALAILGPMAVTSIRYVVRFPPREATRQVLLRMNAIDGPGTPVYLVFSNYLQWAYYAGDWSQPKRLKERIDKVYSCSFCTNIAFLGSGGSRTEIVGTLPPRQPGAIADEQWAGQEAARIVAGSGGAHIWLFLPLYSDSYQPRKLLEMLLEKLQDRHAYLVNRIRLGDTIALRYALKPM